MNTPQRFLRPLTLCALLIAFASQALAEEAPALSKVAPEVLSKEQRTEAAGMIDRDIRRRTDEVNARNREEWRKITTRAQWEKYRDERLTRLRSSLGEYPAPSEKLKVRVTGTVKGEGFTIEKLVYESRPGQWVPAHLYVPTRKTDSMPGILIAHAHHRDKPQGELQDMGMTWARAGCLVLIHDQVGYGERRSHPFNSAADFPQKYRPDRQDYFFRYDTGVQLQLAGDSLMGWFVWDLMRGVDLLLAQEGIDAKRIILLGAVAGGGDPAAVTAALDRRIACCVPFNFGGPQPETRLPLPADPEARFDYLAGTYWDSTRGLRLGGRDDFLHWIIVGAMAPRRLIYAHEFAWDRDNDPVWKRYQKIWGEFDGVPDNIGYTHGKGSVRGTPPDSTHCTNIGKTHRRMIHPLFERWFDIQVHEGDEYSAQLPRDKLLCWTDAAREELRPKSLNELMRELARERIEKARRRLAGKTAAEQRRLLREEWSKLLGPIEAAHAPMVKSQSVDDETIGGVRAKRVVLEVEPGVVVPALILHPAKPEGPLPAVIGLARAGKAGFLKERAGEIEKLVRGGAIVVLPDLRGTGETGSDIGSGPKTSDTGNSVHLQLFGETLLGERLRDLRSVLAYLRERKDVDARRIALWGDSFTPPNPPETNFKLPREVEGWARGPQPLGGLLALLGALFDEDIHAVHISGGLAAYHPVLEHFAVLVPHGDCVPGALTAGDLCDVAASLSPRPLGLNAMVDHLNRPLSTDALKDEYAPAVNAYSAAARSLSLAGARSSPAAWLLEHLH
jgi:cephalosporin-C deacetylase-like acetyl esterase